MPKTTRHGGASIRVFDAPRVKADDAASEDVEAASEVVDLTKMTVAELRDYAAKEDIDLAGAKTKAEIVDVIAAAPLPPALDGGEQETA